MTTHTLTPATATALGEEVLQRMSAHGLRLTRNRRRLVEVLIEAGRPMTVETVLAVGAELPMSSVYRDLRHLCDAGVVERLALLDDRQHFQLVPELLGHWPLHFVCVNCHGVTSAPSPTTVTAAVRRAERSATNLTFTVARSRIALTGRCGQCRAQPVRHASPARP